MTASEITMPRICLLPLGATEQHGPHLPVETDTIIAQAVASRASALVESEIAVELLPVEPIGYSPEHGDWPQTQTLGHAEAIDRWIGLGEAANARGIRRFVMLNAHGGNSPLMTIVATELRVRHAMLAVATSWTRFAYPDTLVPPREKALGIHGGLVETSVMLALRPDLVDMAKARDFPSRQAGFERNFTHLRAYGPHAFGWKMGDLSPDGVVGDAAGATARIGEELLANAAAGLADLLRDVARFDVETLR
jgi:creatinine amidohydrolase